MKLTLWLLGIALGVYLVDLACGHFLAWRERKDAHIKAALLRKWNIAAFNGTRKFDDPRWPT